MAKRADLSAALQAVSGRPGPPAPRTQEKPEGIRQGREGKRTIAGHFDPEVSAALKELGLKRRAEKGGSALSVQELMAEAFNDLFEKYGMARIA